MSKWQELRFSDVIELIGGGTPKTSIAEYWNGDIPWLSVVDFNTGKKYVSDTEKKITEQGLQNSSTKMLQRGDIIISARGTVGVIAILEKAMAFNQSCYGIRARPEFTTNEFVYYLLKDSVNNFLQIAHGGVFDTITRDTFQEIDISLPPPKEQQAITAVLSSLDDKIDLLHRQNKTLEALAQTLFRHWFTNGANEGWEECSLYDAIELVGGGTPKTDEDSYWGGDIYWLSGGDIASSHKNFVVTTDKRITEIGLSNSSAKLLPKFSTVISARGTVGKYCILSEPMTFSQSNYGIKPKFPHCYFFTYLLIDHSVSALQSAAYGSVFDTITTRTFKNHIINIPTEAEIQTFEIQVAPFFHRMNLNQKQIHTLEKLRDTFLPKLMTGEVRVLLDEENLQDELRLDNLENMVVDNG